MSKYLDKDVGLPYLWSKLKVMLASFSALTDVDVTGVTDGQVPAYNNTTHKWENHTLDKTDVGLDNVPNVATNDQTPTFTEAATRTNIDSGDSLSAICGKVQKWLDDLHSVAFSGSYNDLTDKPTIPAAQIQSDWNQTSTTAKDYIKNKPAKIVAGTGITATAGTGQYTWSVSYGTTAATACVGNDSRLSDSRTPTSHASTGTGYGAGTASYYGHVKLSDTYTSNPGGASSAIGASGYAVSQVYALSAKKTANTFTGSQVVNKTVGVDNNSYQNAQFVAQSLWSDNNSSRAGYGFHNNGKNGAFLYLDTDGALKVRFNSGTVKTVSLV